jgi:hypothetical protein
VNAKAADQSCRADGVPAISVEVAGKSDAVVTVRDRHGRMLYRLDPAGRMTIVAKRMTQTSDQVSVQTAGASW